MFRNLTGGIIALLLVCGMALLVYTGSAGMTVDAVVDVYKNIEKLWGPPVPPPTGYF